MKQFEEKDMKLNTDKNTGGVKYAKTAISLLMSVLTLGGVIGCMTLFPPTEKWKEEVQLSDGRIIVVERESKYERGGGEWAHNRRGIKPDEYRIRFVYPEGSEKTIEWRSLKKSETLWPEVPLILDFESGYPIVFSAAGVGPGCLAYSKYIYKNDLWVEEALPNEGIEVRATNLFLRVGVDIVDLEAKRSTLKDSHRSRRQVGPTRVVCF